MRNCLLGLALWQTETAPWLGKHAGSVKAQIFPLVPGVPSVRAENRQKILWKREALFEGRAEGTLALVAQSFGSLWRGLGPLNQLMNHCMR